MSSIALGWVRIKRSLLPRRSRLKSLKRSPRNAASSYSSPWIMVPMAPSSIRMRSRAAAIRAVRLGETATLIGSGGFLCAMRPQAEQMADGEHEVGAVPGGEMKGTDAVLGEFLHLAGRDGGRHQLAGFGIVVEAVEFFGEPVRHAGAGTLGEIGGLLEILHRQNPRHDWNPDAARPHPVKVTEVEIVIEEELRDRPGGAGIDLGLEHVDIGIEARALRVLFRIGRYRHLDIAVAAPDRGDQIGRTAIALRMRRVDAAESAGGIAAQR